MSRPAQHIPAGAVLTDAGWTTAAGEPYLGRVELAAALGGGRTSADVRRWSSHYGPKGKLPLWPDHDPAVGLADDGRRYLPLSAARAWLRERDQRRLEGRREAAEHARTARAARWVQRA